ncbi:MAG: MazG nucleotide pyrophosphohydrolase domain-containing protein [Minisyncoccia bacterium]
MEFKKLLNFVAMERERLAEYTGRFPDKDKEIFAMVVKIGEEFGELCEQVLYHTSLQGKHKMHKFNKDDLPSEFADVLLTTLILAKEMNIDVEKALENKMEKIEKRYENK